jgi:uncharacterized protein
MPSARSLELDIDRLPADGETRVVSLPQAALPRLATALTTAAGQVDATVTFDRLGATPVLDIRASTRAELVCQRCLQPLHVDLTGESRVGLVETLAQADALPEEVEPVWVEARKVDLGELVEEELLLALPLVPAHERGDPACRAIDTIAAMEHGAPPDDDGGAEEVVQKPFAELAELLKRRK